MGWVLPRHSRVIIRGLSLQDWVTRQRTCNTFLMNQPSPPDRCPLSGVEPTENQPQRGRPQFQSFQTRRVCSVSSMNDCGDRRKLIHLNGHGLQVAAGKTPRLKKKMRLWRDFASKIWPGRLSGKCFGRDSARMRQRRVCRCGCCGVVKSVWSGGMRTM